MRASIVVACLLVYPAIATSQLSTSASRAQQIAADFTKHKEVHAVKHGVTRDKYKDVRAELVIAPNVSEYAGRYESDFGWWIEIQVGAGGQIRGIGEEAGERCAAFELKDVMIESGLLTATKVCSHGTTEKLEAAFLNRTDRDSSTDTGTTMFGLGVVLAPPREVSGNTFEKVFYRLDR